MNDSKYLRVGTQYYKIVREPTLTGDLMEERLIPWKSEAIRHDEGSNFMNFISNIPKYDGFCVLPNHDNYKPSIGNYFNLYQPIDHEIMLGEFPVTQKFLKHLFGEQYELELDYLAILYKHPIERLPIQLLVSQDRETGKTTYLNLLKAIFQHNVTYNTNDDFRSNFNSHWTSKLLIVIDEVLLQKQEDSEKIKNLSTAKTYKAESKGIDKVEIQFFAKFVLCSNNEEDGIVIQPGETRFWVIKVKTIPEKDPNLLEKLISEIPYFLYFLKHHDIKSPKVSRMWFSFDQIKTPALLKIINNFRGKLEVESIFLIREIMDTVNIEEFNFTNKDLLKLLQRSSNRYADRSKISKLLQNVWGLKPTENSLTYHIYTYNNDGQIIDYNDIGRFYTITREWIDNKYDELMN